ncbi:3-hydroxyacyl-CoA dehydrogenase NAD-binding domain-containing protein [Streptomyces sp. V4I2]|uniref:3-hydroxyacyl-CoA dehydrogenase NAD-binding domain-containing protein n=1 Tax=Streptomyces sp. V4I2 TaxID=3042280 RepID=UPI00277FECD5|nr:3-hydroxyacyl-CoA dehydrogenase [Streptomyces sp. V4I2]
MGSGIAEVAALRGLDVTVAESTPELAAAGRERFTAPLGRGLRRGKLARPTANSPCTPLGWPVVPDV